MQEQNGKAEYRGRTYAKNGVELEPGWISDAFELCETEFYKLMTTVTRDDDSPNIYTVPFGRCDLQTSVDESKYEEINRNVLICPGESISKKEPSKISKKIQFAYTLFLVHLTYSINKAIRIHVLYYPWRQHCIIWLMNMCQNISSSIRKNLFWKFMIKVGCTSAVIFLWDITEKNRKIPNYRIEA